MTIITEKGRLDKVAFLASETFFIIETQAALEKPWATPPNVQKIAADAADFAVAIERWQARGKQLISERKIVSWRIVQFADTIHSTGISTLPAPPVAPVVTPPDGHVPAKPRAPESTTSA